MKRVLSLLVGLMFLVVFDVAMAARPVALDNWTVTGGLVDAPCPATMTCDQIVIDDGFMQRRLTTATGNSYYQFITTEQGGVTGDPNAVLDYSANTLEFSHEVFSRTQSSPTAANQDVFYGNTNVASSSIVNGVESRLAQTADFSREAGANAVNVALVNELTVIDWTLLAPEVTLHQRFTESQNRLGVLNARDENAERSGDLQQTIGLGNGDLQGFIKKFTPTAALGTASYENAGGRNPDLWVGLFRASPAVGSQFTPFSYTRFNGIQRLVSGSYVPLVLPVILAWQSTESISFTDANPDANSSFFNSTGTAVFLKENFNITRAPTVYNPNSLVAFSDFTTFNGTTDYLENQTRLASNASVSPTANGGPPTALNQWSVSNGIITAPCPVGAICSAETSDNGILLRGVSIGGIDYFQTIITEDNATGSSATVVATESFVRADSINGIASTQALRGLTEFDYSAQINSGWALTGAGDVALVLRQRTGPAGDRNNTEFHLRMAANGAKDYTIVSRYGGNTGGSIAFRHNTFYSRTIEGGIQNTSRTLDPLNPLLRGGGLGFVGDGTINNCRPLTNQECLGTSQHADLSWSAGDALQVTWIGESWGNYRSTVPGRAVSLTSVTNLSTGDRAQVSRISRPTATAASFGGPNVAPFVLPTLPDTYVPTF